MTRVVIFTGPTASAESGRRWLPHAEFRSPASCGDVLRAVLEGARVVGLVDGYFDHRLSVWHKEISWAMSRGVVVYGAASMGALRAAELAAFGMRGVGEIFEAYARGELEDDDEVAVTHEAADRGYRPTSEAMVNVRATLAAAVREAVLSPRAAELLVERQKARFYPERTLPSVSADARELLPSGDAGRFCRWLGERGSVNQKLADAEALLRRIAADCAAGVVEGRADTWPAFPHTNAWQALLERVTATLGASGQGAPAHAGEASVGAARAVGTFADGEASQGEASQGEASQGEGSQGGEGSGRDLHARLADIEQSDPVLCARIWQLALFRALAVSLAQRLEHDIDGARVQAEANRMRRELGLFTPRQTTEWLQANDLDVAGFSRLAADSVLAIDLAAPAQRAIDEQLGNVLRLLGHYPRTSGG